MLVHHTKKTLTTEIATINVARDFSRYPAGRFTEDGPYSGARFRDEVLVPALAGPGQVRVELDGVLGYGSSFLEEAFGGLVRELCVDVDELKSRLVLISRDSSLLAEIGEYIEMARP